MRRGLAVLACLAMAGMAWAQTIVSYELRFFAAGATQPQQTQTLAAAAFVCDQANPPPSSVVNPTRVIFDDAARPGRVCIYTAQPGDPLLAFPVGLYEADLIAVDDAGLRSGPSNRAPFESRANPVAVLGLRFVR